MDYFIRRKSRNSSSGLIIFIVVLVSCVSCKPHSKKTNRDSNHNDANFNRVKTAVGENPLNGQEVVISPRHKYCAYENVTYEAGRRFRPDPCMQCHCPRHGGRVQCFIEDCRHLANCIKYSKRAGQCCGVCQQVGCEHTNGRKYRPGQVMSLGPCERCECPLTGGKLQCDKVACPQTACVNPIRQQGDCCETCPNGANCWFGNLIIPATPGRHYRMDKCKVCQCPQAPVPFWMRGRALQAVCHSIC